MQLASFLQLETETNQAQQEGHTEKKMKIIGNSMQRIGWHHHECHYRGDIDDFLDSPTRKPRNRVARIRHFYRFDCPSPWTQKTDVTEQRYVKYRPELFSQIKDKMDVYGINNRSEERR